MSFEQLILDSNPCIKVIIENVCVQCNHDHTRLIMSLWHCVAGVSLMVNSSPGSAI